MAVFSILKQPLNIPIHGKPVGLKDDRAYALVQNYTYRWRKHDTYYRLTIPRGYKYDGASVPRPVWTISGIRPDGLLRAAATVHDWLYIHRGEMPRGCYQRYIDGEWVDVNQIWSRESADRMFGRLMREAGMKRWRRRAAYRAVRTFGGLYWKTGSLDPRQLPP